ncbi:MAG: hypothetical protein DRP57_09545 [Spirochaetes bacterium]|nr:MAG: hypothetical protein DRP57_09545 [Spirochaetota bacterium]
MINIEYRHMNKSIYWYGALIFVMIVWATVYPITKMIVSNVDPLFISFLRYLIGLVPIAPFFIHEVRKNRVKFKRNELIEMSLIGLLGVTAFALFLFYGIELSTASNGSLLANTQPIFTTLIAPLIISESFSFSRILGAVIGLVGISLVVTGGNFTHLDLSEGHYLGNFLLVLSALSMSVYSILIKKHIANYGGLIPTFITMVSGVLFLSLPILIIENGFGSILSISLHDWLLLAYVGVVGTAIVYLMFNSALKHLGVIRSVGFKLFIPVFGVLFSVLMLGEKPGFFIILGALIVIGAVYFIQRVPGKTKAVNSMNVL